jgi:hypothetical protein
MREHVGRLHAFKADVWAIRDAIYFVLDLLTGNWSIKYTTVRNY